MLKHTLLSWLATCFVGTGLLCVYIGLAEDGFKDPYMEALVLLALGITLVASIPAMIIYGVILDALLRRMAPAQAKAVCSGYAIIATIVTYFITFGLIGGNFNNAGGGLLLATTIPFAVCFALAPWLIPMPRSRREVVPDSTIFENPEFPSGTPPAYTVVVAIVGCLLLYSLIKLFSGGPAFLAGKMAVALIWYLLDIGLTTTALILFIRWSAAGWKLLTGLSAGGVAGSIFSLAMMINMAAGRGALTGYLVSMCIFMLAQAIVLYLLSPRELQLRFGATTRDYGIWIIAGIGYAIVRMVLIRMTFHV